jgi:micrococcal nuclease
MKALELYNYKARLVSIYDGDTITIDVDQGFSLTHRMTVRLYGINTPEVRGKTKRQGLESRDRLATFLAVGGLLEAHFTKEKRGSYEYLIPRNEISFLVKTLKDDSGKYGRMLASLVVDRSEHVGNTHWSALFGRKNIVDVNEHMVEKGYAVEYMKTR